MDLPQEEMTTALLRGEPVISDNKSLDAVYEIKVQGKLDRSWESCLDNLIVNYTGNCDRAPSTVLIGRVADQAALRGVLCKLWDLNLTLISIRRIEMNGQNEAIHD